MFRDFIVEGFMLYCEIWICFYKKKNGFDITMNLNAQ